MSRILASFFLIFFSLSSFLYFSLDAQSIRYRKNYVQPWEEQNPVIDEVLEQFKNQSAVILEENTEWKINTLQNNTFFQKQVKIKFLTEEGLKAHNHLTIPESIDPAREYSDLPLIKRSEVHRPKYYDLQLVYIKARRIQADGTVNHLSPEDKIESESLPFDSNLRTGYSYSFKFPEMKVGEVLEIEYKYHLPYTFDWRRIFFHDDIAKQKLNYKITYPSSEYLVLECPNGGNPVDTIFHENKRSDADLSLVWKFENLPACISEVASKPYTELPYINYYLHNKIYGQYANDQLVELTPYPWNYIAYDQINFEARKFKAKRRLSAREIALNNFFEPYSKEAKESPAMAMLKFHSKIAKDFRYLNIPDHFANSDSRLGKIPEGDRSQLLTELNKAYVYYGSFNRLTAFYQLNVEGFSNTTESKFDKIPSAFSNRRIKNINRYSIYEGLLDRLKQKYCLVRVSDKRIASINPDWCSPILGDNKLFAANIDKNLFYVQPKIQRLGLSINELPFYLENTPSLHIRQMAEEYNDVSNILLFQTPQSGYQDNQRKTEVVVEVLTDQNKVNFDTKLSLTGQYSTLTRSFYLHGTADSTINSKYLHWIYDLSGNTTQKFDVPNKTQSKFPYKSDINLKYTNLEILNSNKSGGDLDLKNWFWHIYHNNFVAQSRNLNYYPDFQGRDQYIYHLKFDKEIEIKQFKDLPLNIENSFGKFHFSIEQTGAKTVSIISDFHVIADMVKPENAKDVEEIYVAIKQLEKAKLAYKIKP